jgi:cyclopropane fatty-acyl-phospholipid synthase-like methyltransferase
MFYYFDSVTQCRAAGLDVFNGEEDNLYARLTHHPNLEKIFHEAMQARSKATNLEFVKLVRFSKFSRILDVGGGSGENLSTIAHYHPRATGTLLDFPSVAKIAAKRFRDEGLSNRFKAVGLDIFAEDFPKGHNCILFCHFTPIFSEKICRKLVRKAYEALESNGLVCIYTTLMRDDERGPLHSALLSPYFLCTVSGVGRHYSWKETRSWLQEAGFINITKAKLIRSDGVVLGFKP